MGQRQLQHMLEELQEMLSYRRVRRSSKKATLSRSVTLVKTLRKELKGAMQFSCLSRAEKDPEPMEVDALRTAETVVWRVRHQAKFWTEEGGGALDEVREAIGVRVSRLPPVCGG
jgi:hypothetical protein